MKIQYRCSECNQMLETKEDKIGYVVICPTCNSDVVVPSRSITNQKISADEYIAQKTGNTTSPSQEVNTPTKKFCRHCGSSIFAEAVICVKCGCETRENKNSTKSLNVYQILAFLVGGLGIHNFYAGRNAIGFAQLLITLFTFGCAWFIVIPWAIVEIFVVRTDGNGNKML